MNPYLAIVLLMIGSAFFSSSEIAYAAANKSRLKKAADSGSRRAKWAVEISDNYDKALCTVLIGNNLVNISSSSVATIVAMALVGDAGVAVATGVMTFLLLIFGEILPKQLAKQFCDNYALLVSPILRFCMWITKPLVWLFMRMIAGLSKLWKRGEDETALTYEDLITVIETVEEEGVIDEDNAELLQSVIEFDEREVQEVATHRVDMLALDINDPADELIKTAVDSDFSRIPVYDDSIDEIIGILPVATLLKELLDDPQPDLRALLQEPAFVPHTKKLPKVLEQMREEKIHMMIVTDDHGGTLGCVTMEDILEEIVGEIWDETDEIEEEIVELEEDLLLVDGDTMLGDLLDYLEEVDPELEDDIITVNGWVTEIMGDYPEEGDTFTYRHYQITVDEVDDLVASKLKVKILEVEEEEDD